jgi:transcription elongation factor/antiterminator RfaH
MVSRKKKRTKHWYALYTRSRLEKRTEKLLAEKGIQVYLPLQKRFRQWSDRKKWVYEPLFRSYVFVYISKDEYSKVVKTEGVVRFVTFEGEAARIPPQQIKAVKHYEKTGEDLEDKPAQYTVGDKVVVTRGPMKGLEGMLVEHTGKKRVRVEIHGINKSLFIKLRKSYLAHAGHAGKK